MNEREKALLDTAIDRQRAILSSEYSKGKQGRSDKTISECKSKINKLKQWKK